MGSNSSTRRVSFEADENDNVTIVKGIRLSENVINRMRDSSPPAYAQPPPRAAVPPPPRAAVPPPPLLPVAPLLPASPPVAPPPPPPPPAIDEEELRRKIAAELQRGLELERSKAEKDLLKRLEDERAQAHVQAQAQVQEEVGRILETERAAAKESIKRAVLKERVTAEDERLRAQFYEMERKAQQLEERDRDLRKQEVFYKEQVAKLEDRSAQFYKVTTENYQKAADEVNAKFKRYEINPVCADLQGEILKCYRENTGQTLSCSSIASQYMQCVNNAKQNKVRTGG